MSVAVAVDPTEPKVAARFDLVEKLFVAGAFVAGLNLSLFQALTAYDLMIAGLAVLIVAGPRRLQLPPRYLIFASLAFAASALASMFRALHPFEAFTQVLQFGFVFWVQIPVVLTVARTRSVVHTTILAFVGGTATSLVAALVMGEEAGANRLATYYTDNANALGLPVAFLTPLLLFYVVNSSRRRRPALTLIAAAGLGYLFLWILSAAASRAAAVATVAGIVVFLLLRGGRIAWRRLPLRVATSALIVGGVGLLIFGTGLFPSRLEERVLGTLDADVQTVADQRTSLNRAGIHAFAESPLVGVGLNNFRHVSQLHDDAGTFHDPHNLWVQFLAQIGLVGALAFLALLIGWFVDVYRAQALALTRADRELCWAFIAAMVAILTFHMASPIMIQRNIWLVFALGLAFAQLVFTQTRSTSTDEGETP